MLPTDLDPTVILGRVARCIASADVTSKACKKLLGTVQGLTKLKEACLKPKNEKTVVCRIVNQIPGLPNLPGGELPSGLPTELPGLPGLGHGLGRAGSDPPRPPRARRSASSAGSSTRPWSACSSRGW